jgi:hypothetical protein
LRYENLKLRAVSVSQCPEWAPCVDCERHVKNEGRIRDILGAKDSCSTVHRAEEVMKDLDEIRRTRDDHWSACKQMLGFLTQIASVFGLRRLFVSDQIIGVDKLPELVEACGKIAGLAFDSHIFRARLIKAQKRIGELNAERNSCLDECKFWKEQSDLLNCEQVQVRDILGAKDSESTVECVRGVAAEILWGKSAHRKLSSRCLLPEPGNVAWICVHQPAPGYRAPLPGMCLEAFYPEDSDSQYRWQVTTEGAAWACSQGVAPTIDSAKRAAEFEARRVWLALNPKKTGAK